MAADQRLVTASVAFQPPAPSALPPLPGAGGGSSNEPRFTPSRPWLALLGFVGLCLLVGAAGGALTATSVHDWYPTLNAPPGKPPNWVFGPVWTTLYVMMGASAWLVWKRAGAGPALRLWGWHLAANALWTPLFFGLRNPGAALIGILLLLVLLIATIRAFRRVSRLAEVLLWPYLAWVLFATWLNLGFWWLNRA